MIYTNIYEAVQAVCGAGIIRMIISKPTASGEKYHKIAGEKSGEVYYFSLYTQTQVFHKTVEMTGLCGFCEGYVGERFRQLNAWDKDGGEWMLMVSKKGKISVIQGGKGGSQPRMQGGHNREKSYLLKEGEVIQPLVDMGIFTKEGRVVRSMYDKYRQINRFMEMLHDECKKLKKSPVRIVDFGCGKSYLTFVVYHYFTEILGLSVEMVGLDLKGDVIQRCNETARRYRYDNLHFYQGNIREYELPFTPDVVMSLHACDTATDFVLHNAVRWGAELVFAVPCCQHELNSQLGAGKDTLLTRYGLVRERFAALLTDTLRGEMMEAAGYKTQLMEFVDFAHTPKNILLRAVLGKGAKTPDLTHKSGENAHKTAVEEAMELYGVNPTLYTLLWGNNSD